MIYRDATFPDIYFTALNMRDRDFLEISAVSFCDTRETLATEIGRTWSASGNCLACCSDNGEPIAILNYVPIRPGVWSMGLFATDKIKQIGLSLTKLVCYDIIPALDRAKAHRVECHSIDGYDEIHRWLEFCGMRKESVIRKYGKNEEDFINFAWVRGSYSVPFQISQEVH